MLYDPKWEAEIKPDVFSLENLIAWLEKMPSEHRYDYYRSGECVVGQWVRSIDPNFEEPPNSPSFTYVVFGKEIDLDRFSDIAVSEPWTFGGTLSRASAALRATLRADLANNVPASTPDLHGEGG